MTEIDEEIDRHATRLKSRPRRVSSDRMTHKAHEKDQDGSTFAVKSIMICDSIRLRTLIREGRKYKEKARIAMQNKSGRVSLRVWALSTFC